jgi:hypothetical protein
MLNKRNQMAMDRAASSLQADELIEMATYTNVGSVSVKRVVATAAVVAVATAGIFTAFARPRKAYLVLTSHRLIFLDGQTVSGRPGKTLFTLGRAGVSVTGVRRGLVSLKVDLAIQGQEKALRLTYPTVTRKSGEAMVAALQANVPLSAAKA